MCERCDEVTHLDPKRLSSWHDVSRHRVHPARRGLENFACGDFSARSRSLRGGPACIPTPADGRVATLLRSVLFWSPTVLRKL
jgi:hypothetical protein